MSVSLGSCVWGGDSLQIAMAFGYWRSRIERANSYLFHSEIQKESSKSFSLLSRRCKRAWYENVGGIFLINNKDVPVSWQLPRLISCLSSSSAWNSS
jgi:hypothetical protein